MSALLNKLSSFFNRKPTGISLEVYKSIDNVLTQIDKDTALLKLEFDIKTATGEWLEEYGSWFGVYRNFQESDEDYRQRIFAQMVRATTTIPALQKAVADYYNTLYKYEKYKPEDIDIVETFKFLKAFSKEGTFSGIHRFPDETMWRHNVLDIHLKEPATEELIKIINDTKAGGVKVYYTAINDDFCVYNYPKRYNPYDGFLQIDLFSVTSSSRGLCLSSSTSGNIRARSGRRDLYGTESFILIERESNVKAYNMIDRSYIYKLMIEKNILYPEYVVPPQNPSMNLSVEKGSYSGYQKPYIQYKSVTEYEEKEKAFNLQMPTYSMIALIKPSTFSDTGGMSIGHARSGLLGEKYEKKIKTFTTNVIVSYNFQENIDTEYQLEKEIGGSVKRYKRDRIRSGRQLTWTNTENIYSHVQKSIKGINPNSEVLRLSDMGVYGTDYPYVISSEISFEPNIVGYVEKELSCKISFEDTLYFEVIPQDDPPNIIIQMSYDKEPELRLDTPIITVNDMGYYGTSIPAIDAVNIRFQPNVDISKEPNPT